MVHTTYGRVIRYLTYIFDTNKEYVTRVVVIKGATITNTLFMHRCTRLESVDVSKLVNVTQAGNMFNHSGLIHVDISGLRSLKNTVGMLNNCPNLLTVVGVEAATRNSLNNRAMFAGSRKLRCIDGMDSRASANNVVIFLECDALTQPSAAYRAALERVPGTLWRNNYSCA